MRKNTYKSFGGIVIPVWSRSDDLSTPKSQSGLIETVGGWVDAYGTLAPIKSRSISVSLSLVGDSIESDYMTWSGLVRKKSELHRYIAGVDQYAWARLMELSAESGYEGSSKILEIKAEFEIISKYWYGASHDRWFFDDGTDLNAGSYFDQNSSFSIASQTAFSTTLTNRGSAPCTDAVIEITALSDTAIASGLQIKIDDNTSIQINHIIAGGETLRIDSGKKSISCAGTGCYSDLAILSDHTKSDWLYIDPGSNTLTVKLADDNSFSGSVTIHYDNKYM